MKANKFYRIEFLTKRGGNMHWVVDVEAQNAQQAKQEAAEMWHSQSDYHMFHIHVRALRPYEEFLYHWFECEMQWPHEMGED